jgi:hypothetical protein
MWSARRRARTGWSISAAITERANTTQKVLAPVQAARIGQNSGHAGV